MKWLELVLHIADSFLRSVMGMRPKFLLRRAGKSAKAYARSIRPISKNSPRHAMEMTLVHNRPTHLEDRYVVADLSGHADKEFKMLRMALLQDCDQYNQTARADESPRLIHRELGVTVEGRKFAYFKPFNDSGWLVERSGAGWRVSRAEKIVSQNMFLRSNQDPWDVVTVFEDSQGEGQIRVKSQRFGGSLMSTTVYLERMKVAFGSELSGEAA